MNNLRKHHLGIKLLLLALFLAALPTRVLSAEEQTGRLTVMLPDTVTDQLPASPAPEIAFYQIGILDTANGGDWKMNDGFEEYGVLEEDTTSGIVEIATRIAGDIPGMGVSPEVQAMDGGTAVFQDLPQGLYLGVCEAGPEGLDVTPFLVSVPDMDPEIADCFDYAVTVKAFYIPPGDGGDGSDDGDDSGTGNDTPSRTPSRTPTRTPTRRPTVQATKTPSSSSTRRASVNKATGTSPVKTGDGRSARLWISFMLTAFCGITLLILRGKRRYKRE